MSKAGVCGVMEKKEKENGHPEVYMRKASNEERAYIPIAACYMRTISATIVAEISTSGNPFGKAGWTKLCL